MNSDFDHAAFVDDDAIRAGGEFLRRHALHDSRFDLADLPPSDLVGTATEPALALWAIFRHGLAVDTDVARQLFGAENVGILIAAGMLTTVEEILKPAVEVDSWHGLLIAADSRLYKGADAVFSVSQTTETLDALRLCKQVEHAVDVGCGSGALALRLAGHADHVTAIDVNPRAVRYTAFNALLNGFPNITSLEGRLLAPIERDSVDLILGNLPFVLSPDQTFLYRDGDRDSQQLIPEVLGQAEDALRPGGVGQFLCNWAIRTDRVTSLDDWVRGRREDLLTLSFSTQSVVEHAEDWLDRDDYTSGVEHRTDIRRWVKWFRDNNVERVAFGAINVRKSNRQTARDIRFEAEAEPTKEGGQQLSAMLSALDLPLEWDEIRDLRPRLVPQGIYQRLDYGDDGFKSRAAGLVPKKSAGVGKKVSTEFFPLIFEINGNKSLGELAGENHDIQNFLRDLLATGLAVADP